MSALYCTCILSLRTKIFKIFRELTTKSKSFLGLEILPSWYYEYQISSIAIAFLTNLTILHWRIDHLAFCIQGSAAIAHQCRTLPAEL